MPEPARLYTGVCAEARAALLQAFAGTGSGCDCSIALIPDPRGAAALAAELRSYTEWAKGTVEVLLFPEDPPPDIDAKRRNDRICDRLAVLSRLLDPAGRALLIATPEALLGACPERAEFERQQIELRVGEEVDFQKLVERLTFELNYDAEALCEHPGQVATRGGLIDIYPYDAPQPYRLDFFGDEIESIRAFDPTSQRSAEVGRPALRSPQPRAPNPVSPRRAGSSTICRRLPCSGSSSSPPRSCASTPSALKKSQPRPPCCKVSTRLNGSAASWATTASASASSTRSPGSSPGPNASR